MSQWNPVEENVEVVEAVVEQPVAEGYTPPPVPPKKDNKKLLIIIASIVGALLLCCILVTAFGGCATLLAILGDDEADLSDIVNITVDGVDEADDTLDEAFDYTGDYGVDIVKFGETVWLDGVSFTVEEDTDALGDQEIFVYIENTSTKDFYLPIESNGESNWTAQAANEDWLGFSYTEWDLGFTESTMGMVKPGEAYSLTLKFKNSITDERTDAIFVTASLVEPLEGVGVIVWMTPEWYELYQNQ
jgi:hypothetical protein